MNDRSDGPLLRRLDGLEDKGRGVLAAASRRAIGVEAAWVAAWVAVAAALVSLILTATLPIDGRVTMLSALVIPVLTFAIAYAFGRARIRIDRVAALAWVDRALALRDRAVTAAEFARVAHRDGYREAALQEAAPWLARAAAMPLDGPEGRPSWRRPAVPLVGAAILLVAAMGVDRDRDASDRGAVAAAGDTLRRAAAALGLSIAADRAAVAGREGVPAGSAPGEGAGATRPVAGRDAAGDAGAARPGDGAPGTAVGSSNGAASDSGASGGLSAMATPGGRDRAGAARAAGSDPAAAEGRSTPPAGSAGASAMASPAAAAPPPPAARAAGAKPGQHGAGGRSRFPGQQSAGSGAAGNTSGQQGGDRGGGQDGVKRSRGVAMLMLAVPMEDRVVGTINAGSVSTTTRDAPPRPSPAGVVAAQSRGAGQPQAGRILHRARTAQEDRLLESYFRRPGVER